MKALVTADAADFTYDNELVWVWLLLWLRYWLVIPRLYTFCSLGFIHVYGRPAICSEGLKELQYAQSYVQ
jgi:hypothetical protein